MTSRGKSRVVALEYHDVIEDSAADTTGYPGGAANSYKLSPTQFDAHLDAIAGVSPSRRIAASELATYPGTRHPVLITFDDGGASAVGEIAPRLERHGWRGHFFIATGRIGTPGFVSEADIRELHERGHVVGSHSVSHPLRFGALEVNEMRREWTESLTRLRQILQTPVDVASVPGGYFTRAVADAAASAGIRTLFTSEPVATCVILGECLVVGRFTLRADDDPRVAKAFAEAALGARVREQSIWTAKKVVKAVGGRAYLRLRERLLG